MESAGDADSSGLGAKGLGKIAAINANWLAATNEKAAALAAAAADPNPMMPPLSTRSNASNVSGVSALGSKRKRDGASSGRLGDEEYDDDNDDDEHLRPPRDETEAERKIRLEGW